MKVIVSALLLLLVGWLVPYSWQERRVRQAPDLLSEDPAAYAAFADAQYRFGYQAFLQGRLDPAKGFFSRAISKDVLYLDAWLKLAEVEVGRGNEAHARRILQTVVDLTPEVLRWKWTQVLLARDLGMEDIFTAGLNTLVRTGRQVNDAFYLLETHYHADVATVLERLLPENREPYLRWLMQWRRTEDAILAWKALPAPNRTDQKLRLSFIHFLSNNDKIQMAQELWRPSADPAGITNPGFEGSLTQAGFDWRFNDRKDEWAIRTTTSPSRSGRQALEIHFSGVVNSNFSSLYQLAAISPAARYRLTFWWKAKQITSDQGPFLEILGKDCKGLYHKGPMLLGTEDWHQVQLEFDAPEGCDTALIRLRRLQSKRFDNKIGGTLWLDDFSLQPLGGK